MVCMPSIGRAKQLSHPASKSSPKGQTKKSSPEGRTKKSNPKEQTKKSNPKEQTKKSSPEGTNQLSPARQRWERRPSSPSPGGTTDLGGPKTMPMRYPAKAIRPPRTPNASPRSCDYVSCQETHDDFFIHRKTCRRGPGHRPSSSPRACVL